MNYYRRFPGDYARDTRHLSMLEHGAYTLLLDTLYSTGELPRADKLLFKICGASSKRERKAVKNVLSMFFLRKPGGFSHKRFEEELKHSESRVKAAQENGKHGGRPRKHKPTDNPDHNPAESSPAPAPAPEKDKTKDTQQPSVLPGFRRFFEAYPRKIDFYRASFEWAKNPTTEQHVDEVLLGLAKWATCPQWQNERYIPNPENFIRNRRWESEPPMEAANGKQPSESFAERRARESEDALSEVSARARAVVSKVAGQLPNTRGD